MNYNRLILKLINNVQKEDPEIRAIHIVEVAYQLLKILPEFDVRLQHKEGDAMLHQGKHT